MVSIFTRPPEKKQARLKMPLKKTNPSCAFLFKLIPKMPPPINSHTFIFFYLR